MYWIDLCAVFCVHIRYLATSSCYKVSMYVTRVPNRGSPPAILLRESCREGGRVKTRTLANLTRWPEHETTGRQAAREIAAIAASPGATRCGRSRLTSRPAAAVILDPRAFEIRRADHDDAVGVRRCGQCRSRPGPCSRAFHHHHAQRPRGIDRDRLATLRPRDRAGPPRAVGDAAPSSRACCTAIAPEKSSACRKRFDASTL